MASAVSEFEGEALTELLKRHGFERLSGESDWDFRRRIFPDFYPREPQDALQILLGAVCTDWDEREKMLVMAGIMFASRREEYAKFAEGFASDPIVQRRKKK
jgi:hypothetical protein